MPCQRGGPIHLVEGQRYYLEVLHKQGWGVTDDHVSLARQPPGQPRSLLAGTALAADQPHPADENNDFLPDTWQTNEGLVAPAYTAVQRGQVGDPDGDGLPNLV